MRTPTTALDYRGQPPVVGMRSDEDMQQNVENSGGEQIERIEGIQFEGLAPIVDEREGGMVANQENHGSGAHDDGRPEKEFLADSVPASAPVEDASDYAHCAGLSLVLSLIFVPALLLAIPFAPAMGIRVPSLAELLSMAALYGFLWLTATRSSPVSESAAGTLSCDMAKTLLVWRAIILLGAVAVAGWTSDGSSAAVFPLLTIGAWLGALVEGGCLAAVARLQDIPMHKAAGTSLRLVFPGDRGHRAAARGDAE